MHIHEIFAICDYRIVEGCDYPWDVYGKECRVALFERHGAKYEDEHYPVEVIFGLGDLLVRQVTVSIGKDVYRWLDPAYIGAYESECAAQGFEPWGEPDLQWVRDVNQLLALMQQSLDPQERPDDTDQVKWVDDK